jgi:hypothetical protein
MCETFGEVSVICPNFCIKLLVFLFYFDFFFFVKNLGGCTSRGGTLVYFGLLKVGDLYKASMLFDDLK